MQNKMLIVLKHEFLQRVKSKSFLVFTILGPLLLVATTVLPAYLASVGSSEAKHITIVDYSGKIGSRMMSAQDPSAAKNDRGVVFDLVSSPSQTTIDSLKQLVNGKKIEGYFVVPATATTSDSSSGTLVLHNANDFSTRSEVEGSYGNAVRAEKLESKGIDPNMIAKISKGAEVETVKLEAGKENKDSGASIAAGYITGFIIYISVLIYGAVIMRSVIEEKNTRVVEIIASSVRPFDLLVGKVLGNGLAGMLQVSIWGVLFAVLSTFGVKMVEAGMGSSLNLNISPWLFIFFVLYFTFGFLMFCTLFAAVGSTAESESDVQQISLPITLIVMIPIFTLSSIIQAPSSSTSVILSLIPLFSPILMMGRIFSEMPPWWQIALSFVLMGATFFGILWVAGRIYRVGILMYGKKFSPKEVFKWIRYS